MKQTRLQFSESDLQRIKDTVARVEKKTSGEIVPFVASSSDDYLWTHGAWILIGWIFGSAGCWTWAHISHWPVTLSHGYLFSSLGMLIGFGLSLSPALRRLLIPAAFLSRYVHRDALAHFMELGLHETRDRTGVLIYLSLFERRVEILADRGIYEKVPSAYWQERVSILVSGIHEGKATEVICRVIEAIGEKLSENFPPRPDDKNEISDHLRTK